MVIAVCVCFVYLLYLKMGLRFCKNKVQKEKIKIKARSSKMVQEENRAAVNCLIKTTASHNNMIFRSVLVPLQWTWGSSRGNGYSWSFLG